MFGLDSFWHWAMLLAVVVLLFGTGKLRNAGRDLGTAIAGFRKSMREGDSNAPVPVPLDKADLRERP